MFLTEINIYPVKSLKGIALSESVVEKRGLRFDRRWMLTDVDGMFFTQREVPKMATINVDVNIDGLTVSAPGVETIAIPAMPDQGSRQTVTVWQSVVEAIAYNGYVREWFSDALATKCQLVVMPERSERHVSPRFDTGGDIVSFADGYPLLLIGEATLDDLNRRLEENWERHHPADEAPAPLLRQGGEKYKPLPMNRFRPNVVVKGGEALEEDGWARLRIGEMLFRVAKPCARCVITTIDQARGEFDGKEPLKTMATYRQAKDVHPGKFESFGQTATAVLFGENLIPENPGGTIRIGDRIEVLERR